MNLDTKMTSMGNVVYLDSVWASARASECSDENSATVKKSPSHSQCHSEASQQKANCIDLMRYNRKRGLRVNALNKQPRYVNLLDVDQCALTHTQYIIEESIKLRLRLDPGVRLDVDENFENLGLDFLILFELKKVMSKVFKVRLSSVEFSLFSSIASLADHVIEQQKERSDNVLHYSPLSSHGQLQQRKAVLRPAGDNVVSIFNKRPTKQPW